MAKPWRCKEYREWVKARPCFYGPIVQDRCSGPMDPHHYGPPGDKAKGVQESDRFVVPACRRHHDQFHNRALPLRCYSQALHEWAQIGLLSAFYVSRMLTLPDDPQAALRAIQDSLSGAGLADPDHLRPRAKIQARARPAKAKRSNRRTVNCAGCPTKIDPGRGSPTPGGRWHCADCATGA